MPPSGKPKSHRKLLFSIKEKCNILQGKILTDESVNIAQKLLAKQFPRISGLIDTCLLQKLNQSGIIPVDKLYIQLLHVGSMHWVCISNMETNEYDNGTHYAYDSYCKPKIMLDIVKQVAPYSYHDKSTMSLQDLFSNKLRFPPLWRLVKIHQLSIMIPHYREPI